VTGTAVRDYKTFAEKVGKDHRQFLTLSSGRPQTAEEAVLRMQQNVWSLPDSDNAEAMAAEAEAHEAMRRASLSAAIEQLQKAVRLDAGFTRAWILLAQMQMGGSALPEVLKPSARPWSPTHNTLSPTKCSLSLSLL
jgi:hypothetical protein